MIFATVHPVSGNEISRYTLNDHRDKYRVWDALNMALDYDPSTPEFSDNIAKNFAFIDNKDNLQEWIAAMSVIKDDGDHPGLMNYHLMNYETDWRIVSFVTDTQYIVARFPRDERLPPEIQKTLIDLVDEMMGGALKDLDKKHEDV